MVRPRGWPSIWCAMRRAAAESGSSGYGIPDNSEAALRDHKVDLWPLITITPERQKVIHISKPLPSARLQSGGSGRQPILPGFGLGVGQR